MGKMLEVFKQTGPKVPGPAQRLPPSSAPEPETPASLEGGEETNIPYIEVGGRNEKTEGSADVMACAPAPPAISSPVASRPVERTEAPITPRAAPSYRSVRLQQPTADIPQWVFFSPRFTAEVIAAYDPAHPIAAQYEELLRQILAKIGEAPAPVLWFLGAAPKIGATTTVLNLALTAARRSDQPVTVVEAYAPAPALAQRIGLGKDARALWHQARKPANLRFVPQAERIGQSVATLLEMLRADGGMILADGPNLEDLNDRLTLRPCDGLYIVAREEIRPAPARNLGRPVDGWIVAQ